MLIRSKNNRKAGQKVVWRDKDEYKFLTNDAGDDVCEVVFAKHIDYFLNGSGGAFEPYGEQAQRELEEVIASEVAALAKAEAVAKEAEYKRAKAAAAKAQKAAEDKLKADAERHALLDAQKAKEVQALEEAKLRQAAEKAEARQATI